ncbi:MAG: hypothetical protein NVSMB38_19860 [Ktedonobacteraceae bacterium]
MLKALAVQADQRYQTMREFAQALREPTFDAHANTTLAGLSVPSPSRYPHTPPASQKQLVPAYAYAGVPQPAKKRIAPKAYPVLPAAPVVPVTPPGYVMVPR